MIFAVFDLSPIVQLSTVAYSLIIARLLYALSCIGKFYRYWAFTQDECMAGRVWNANL